MKASDYIVKYLIKNGITDVFGYPGGMVTHLMDSLSKKSNEISTHILLHEDAVAFAACGYAQCTGKIGVAFATSGPGATNLITGIANAFFDSIPTVFITGNVNTYENKSNTLLRQKGFQETDIVSIVKPICKAAFYLDDEKNFNKILNKAFNIAYDDRKGPVLIDIPMNIFRADINETFETDSYTKKIFYDKEKFHEDISKLLLESKRPCILIGNGIKISKNVDSFRDILKDCPVPVISSMIACDIVPEEKEFIGMYYGFIGAYGNRTANFVAAKSDLIICLGTRLSIRQVGAQRDRFAPNATIVRVDIDENELKNKIHSDDKNYNILLDDAIPILRNALKDTKHYDNWLKVCQEIKSKVKYIDEKEPNRIINSISKKTPDFYNVVSDVGQHMVWVAQSFHFKPSQRALFSGGMGSMGYALPASIGIYYATNRPVMCFVGDGGIQMTIEELQYIKFHNLPIKIFIMNNFALGMIRHFQEMYFNKNYAYTTNDNGWSVPDFCKLAKAYGINNRKILSLNDINELNLDSDGPMLYEIILNGYTYVSPKLEYGKPNQDQEPLLDRELYDYIMNL